MVQALPLDTRKRMAKAADAGPSSKAVSKRFDVARRAVIKLMTYIKATGSPAAEEDRRLPQAQACRP